MSKTQNRYKHYYNKAIIIYIYQFLQTKMILKKWCLEMQIISNPAKIDRTGNLAKGECTYERQR